MKDKCYIDAIFLKAALVAAGESGDAAIQAIKNTGLAGTFALARMDCSTISYKNNTSLE